MKIKILLLVSIVFIVIMFNFAECRAEEENFDKELWTMLELHNKLPDDIKDILNEKGLVPWGYFSLRNDNDHVLYAKSNIFSPILITYIKNIDFILVTDVFSYRNSKGSTYTNIRLSMKIKDVEAEKKAEAFFSVADGDFTVFKLKMNENEWITRKPKTKI